MCPVTVDPPTFCLVAIFKVESKELEVEWMCNSVMDFKKRLGMKGKLKACVRHTRGRDELETFSCTKVLVTNNFLPFWREWSRQ